MVGECGRVNDLLTQATVNRRSSEETHSRIDVVHAQSAGSRSHIRNAWLEGDSVTGLEISDAGADLQHGARCLMAENHWLLNNILANTTVRVVMQIRTAYAHGVGCDTQLTGAGILDVRDLTHIDDALLFENNCFHGISPYIG